ncbi:MAG TPA: hypothetical protein PKW33_11365 [Anaerolineaceae bacterium]|nr:hypothetical protein [Anaerolineaceae bacterium]HPN52179.1 hypothetical protein [Anaerolineaceae bacterium]
MRTIFWILTILALVLSGCHTPTAAPIAAAADKPAATLTPLPPTSSPTSVPPTATPTLTPIPPTSTPQPEPTRPSVTILPADGQRVEFQTEDGVTLVGYYYPASVNPAPVVVLMHWAGGDQTDWLYVGMVAWLQNRGAKIPPPLRGVPFDTPYPFPALPENLSFAVFTFDFRGYGESGGSGSPEENILDARAAYQTAAKLEGADPTRVAGIGASIGADAVVDACDGCVGALSLGPGSWLGVPYPQAVKTVDDAKKPVWCVAALDAPGDAETCRAATGTLYLAQIYKEGGHAMTLFRDKLKLDPPIESVILNFLKKVFALP